MNLPNKITISRIILSILTLVLLIVPWYQLGIPTKTFVVAGKIVVDIKYIIAGVFFVIASITDFLDGYLARSRHLITDFGKVMDAIADKILVNGVLIILASQGFISILVPIVVITRDTIVDAIKMACGNKGQVVAASKLGKLKTICMMVGVSLMLFYNLPFELIGFPFADILISIACILSVISGCEYYYRAKDLIFKDR